MMLNGKAYFSLKSVPYGIVRTRGRHFIKLGYNLFFFSFSVSCFEK